MLFGSSTTRNVVHILFLTLLSCTIFGILEIFLMWLSEIYLVPIIQRHYNFISSKYGFTLDMSHLNLFVGGIIASLTIFITTFIEEHLDDKFSIVHTPLFRVLGIICASIFWFCILNFTMILKH